MKRLIQLTLIAACALSAQDSESLAGWEFYKEISVHVSDGLGAITLDGEALAGARDDAADLRVYDASGAEVPYALRILRAQQTAEPFEAEEFNRSTVGDAAEITLDLGESPGEHNQVEVQTAGDNFRRRVSVLGSDDAEEWATLAEGARILRFHVGGQGVSLNRVQYPVSRFRYLRITVAADQEAESTAPKIESARVRRVILTPGEELELPLAFAVREATRDNGRPASTYRFDLPGRVPAHALRFNVQADSFSREYRLHSLEGGNVLPVAVSSGRLIAGDANGSPTLTLRFPEVFTPRLRLTVWDDRNPPLDILQPVVLAATRQVIVDLAAMDQGPLRLYYGNPAADAPRYDFEAALPASLGEDVTPLALGVQDLNPRYVEPEPPLTERAPWLVYVALIAASLALLAILRSLVLDVDSDEANPGQPGHSS